MNEDKDFKDYIDTLPPEIKLAIYSVDYPKQLQEIVKNNKLMIDQAGKLESETTLVMAGIEPMEKYVNNLVEHVGLPKNQAFVVAHDVNELIFKGIRDSLKKINDEMVEEDKLVSESVNVPINNPTKEDVMAGIENPQDIKETSISVSALKSNSPEIDTHEMIDKGIEVKQNIAPAINMEAVIPTPPINIPVKNTPVSISINPAPVTLPPTPSAPVKQAEPLHLNIPPISNIVETKMTSTVVVPKETVVAGAPTKLPEKPKTNIDPYREAAM